MIRVAQGVHRRTSCLIAALVFVCALEWSVAEPKRDGPRALGRKLVERMPPVMPHFTLENCFELVIGEETVGYVTSTLRTVEIPATGDAAKRYVYEYIDVSAIRGPTHESTELKTTAALDRYFEPSTIRWVMTARDANKKQVGLREEGLDVGPAKVTYHSVEHGSPQTTEVARPEGRFIHLTGHLFSLLLLHEEMDFKLREFDTDSKAFVWRTYKVSRKPDGKLRVAMSDEHGTGEAGYFILGPDGRVVEHGAAAVPFTFKACTPERVARIKHDWEVAPPPPKPPRTAPRPRPERKPSKP